MHYNNSQMYIQPKGKKTTKMRIGISQERRNIRWHLNENGHGSDIMQFNKINCEVQCVGGGISMSWNDLA